MTPLALPGSSSGPPGQLLRGLRDFLLATWRGRILLASLVLVALSATGLPLPDVLTDPARFLLLWIYLPWALWRLFRRVLRRMLWKIRTKLILSYLFIAVVPLVLLCTLFVLAGVFFSGLMASHLVTAEVERKARSLQTIAEAVLAGLAPGDAGAAASLEARLAAARRVHPQVAHALVVRGRVVSAQGSAPRALPDWMKGEGFAGLVRTESGELLRAVQVRGESFLALDAPLDVALFADLQQRVGIRLLTSGGRVTTHGGGVQVDVDEGQTRVFGERGSVQLSGMPFVAFAERTDWANGKSDLDPLAFEYRPWEMLRRLSSGSLNTADLLVRLLAIVAVVFLVMYAVALLLGLLLARSITKSVHALSLGTERLGRGDFDTPIRVGSRDQLGELAGSFNHMARGFKDLLRQQAEKERLEEELRIARQIQMSLLPQSGVQLAGVRIAALCVPAAEVGGDYYDLLPLADTRMGVLVADVSGKGTSAALYMAELKGLVLSLSRIYESPARLLAEANRILSANMDTRSFITMTYAVVDTEARTMRYARAGHNPIIQCQASSGATRSLAPQGLGLGLDPGERFEQILEEAEAPLEAGDLFLFFTDGLSEAMNERSELFGEGRLRTLLEQSRSLGSEQVKERILSEIRGFVGGAAQHDDMTLVILEVA
jgi:sigma-B regulation protein RsbU (phosphoserine phosphatase)